MERINKHISQKLYTFFSITKRSELESDAIVFLMTIFIGELEKLILLAGVFAFWGQGVNIILIILVFALLKHVNGGIHFSNFWVCFIFTAGMAFAICIMNRYCCIPIQLRMLVFVSNAVSILFFAPVTNNVDLLSSDEIKRIKVEGVALTLILGFINGLFIHSQIVIYSVAVCQVDLLLGFIKTRRFNER